MMSDKVIKTDSFMEMPHSTKILYFYLMIEADDDGFVANPKTIMRMVNSVDDDFKLLAVKRFIIPFGNGVCVIKHWLIHNAIRADRKIDTQWANEKKLLVVDTKTQKYSLDTGLQPNDNQMTTKGSPRLGKVRLGKTIVSKADVPFNWNEYLKKMDANKSEHIQLLAHFFRVKGMKADTQAEAIAFIKRHTKAAAQVSKFSKSKVMDAIAECKKMKDKDNIEWTVETVLKVLTK